MDDARRRTRRRRLPAFGLARDDAGRGGAGAAASSTRGLDAAAVENPYAAEAAATNAPRGWRNPYAAEAAAATHVITPEGAPFGQAPRWAPPTPWGPPVLPVRTQSEPWTSPQQWSQPPRGPAFPPYGPGGYTPAPPGPSGYTSALPVGGYTPAPPVDHDADFDGAEFSGDEGETPSVKAARAAERRRAGTIEPRIPPRAPWPPRRATARRRRPPKGAQSHGCRGDPPALANALRGWLAAKGGGIYAWQLPDFYKSPACTGLEVPTRKSVKLLRTVENSGLRFTYMPHHNTGSEGAWWIALDHGAIAFDHGFRPAPVESCVRAARRAEAKSARRGARLEVA